jgi:integrase
MEQQSDTTSAPQHHPHRLTGVASAYVETYMTPGGKHSKPQKRYRVRARAGRSGAPLIHMGSFPTRKEANIRLELVSDMLAAGIRPSLDRLFAEAAPTLTVTDAVTRYLKERRNFAERTRKTYKSLQPHIDRAIGTKDVHAVTPDDVIALIGACIDAKLGPDATRSVRGILSGALRHARVRPNPARDETITLPSRKVTRMDVPPCEHLIAIYRGLPDDLLIPVCLLEATGARISELLGVEHGDVDHTAGMLRLVGKGDKPRLVPLPPELGRLLPRVPASERNAAGKLWPGLTADRVRKAMAKACEGMGYHYAPHALRRRFASRHVKIGTDAPQLSAWLGHARTSMTMDVYAKVLVDGDTAEAWRAVIHD